jgi:hypothetical protein
VGTIKEDVKLEFVKSLREKRGFKHDKLVGRIDQEKRTLLRMTRRAEDQLANYRP